MPIRLRNCRQIISLTIDKNSPISDQIAYNIFGSPDSLRHQSALGLVSSGALGTVRTSPAPLDQSSPDRLSVLELFVKALSTKLTANGLAHIISSSLSTLRELSLFVSPSVFSKLMDPLKHCIRLQRLHVGGSVDWKDVEASVAHCKVLSLYYGAKPAQGVELFNDLALSWRRPMFRPFLSVHFSPGVHALFSTGAYNMPNIGKDTTSTVRIPPKLLEET